MCTCVCMRVWILLVFVYIAVHTQTHAHRHTSSQVCRHPHTQHIHTRTHARTYTHATTHVHTTQCAIPVVTRVAQYWSRVHHHLRFGVCCVLCAVYCALCAPVCSVRVFHDGCCCVLSVIVCAVVCVVCCCVLCVWRFPVCGPESVCVGCLYACVCMHMCVCRLLSSPLVQVSAMLLAAWYVHNGEMTIGDLVAVTSYIIVCACFPHAHPHTREHNLHTKTHTSGGNTNIERLPHTQNRHTYTHALACVDFLLCIWSVCSVYVSLCAAVCLLVCVCVCVCVCVQTRT